MALERFFPDFSQKSEGVTMTIVGFNFTKINVEKKAGAGGKVNINNNVSIKDVKEYSLMLGKSEQKGLRFVFEFKSEYEPNMGSIVLNGDVMYLGPNEEVDKVMKEWKKNKKIDPDFSAPILNTVLTRSNIKALILSQDVNLPSPIPLPRISKAPKESKK